MTHVYIAACDKSGGIYHYVKDGDVLIQKQFFPADSVMYMEINDNKLYALLRDPFGKNESYITSFRILSDGNLEKTDTMISTMGTVGCYLTVLENDVFVANYISGSVFRTPDILVKHTGKGINPNRQEAPHTHCTMLTPDKKYICAVDLGVDTLFFYDRELKLVNKVKLPDGSGPRHVVFDNSGEYMYCVTELSCQVFGFKYNDGQLTLISEASALPKGFSGVNTSAAIRYKNGYVYASNRGHDSIAVFKACEGKLNLVDIVSCGGSGPRDFNITENMLICTNEDSNDITFFEIKNGIPMIKDLKFTGLKRPLNVIIKEN